MQEAIQNSRSRVVSSGTLTPDPKYITKKSEYRLLLRLIKQHKLAIAKGKGYNLQAIVQTLNVDPKTARKWLETPKVQQAIAEELEFYIEKMQETGKDDWRMWEKQVELAQGMVDKGKFKNQNQINIQFVTNKEKSVFRIQDAED